MFNWAAFGLGAAGTLLKTSAAYVDIGIMQLGYASANLQAAGGKVQSIANQAAYRSQARSYRVAAQDAMKEAGRAQEQGRQAREMRLVELGQQKGRIIANAAGSGIDVSSRIVDKVISDTVRSAYNDAQALASNEKQAADEEINKAYSLMINADRADMNAEIEGLNQYLIAKQIKLNNTAAKVAKHGGQLSASSTLLGGLANALLAGFSGNAGG